MVGRIYIIKNTINDKVYVGQTTMSIEDRFKQHLNHSKSKNSYEFYQAISELGEENFYIESLEENIDIKDLDVREVYWIKQYDSFDNGYNSTPGGRARHENKILDVDIIIQNLANGMSVEAVSEMLNVHCMTINRALKANGYKTASYYKKAGWRSELNKKIDRNSVKELYLKGYSHNEIANHLDINQRTVSRIIKELGINKKKIIDYATIDLDEYFKDYSLYEQGIIQKKFILNKYGLNQNSHQTILKIINKTKED